jgi:hypothetical protein
MCSLFPLNRTIASRQCKKTVTKENSSPTALDYVVSPCNESYRRAKCNRKTVTVITDDGHQWNVAPVFLSRVIVAEADVQAGQSQVIRLPTKR